MRYMTACKLVSESPLMRAIYEEYGEGWDENNDLRFLVAGYIGALQGADDPQEVMDEMVNSIPHVRSACRRHHSPV